MTDPNFEHVIIDGSLLEGVRIVYFLLSFTKGGQILRNAVSLCVLAKKAVTIEKIRAGRPKPGLSSVALLAQITVPILAFGQRASTLVLKGGTDASFAPPIDYLSEVAEQMSAVAKRLLRNYLPECPININTFRAPDNRFRGNVATFLFVLETSTDCRLAASGLNHPRGPPVEDLVTDAIEELMTSVRAGSCCDKNMQDMLIMPMALADGKSSIRTTALTLHTQSAIYVAEKLLPVGSLT
ncbi:unnamed protein product [Schistocephalus solidus]|uniref:RNA 3'-terminal phosphate cyclase n=1 Tax=Schistocephalus solidus TaxID=70667 RepID=A0A183SCY4_SCHSO|nr:unnamed protein product [Schistocephalus solidus]